MRLEYCTKLRDERNRYKVKCVVNADVAMILDFMIDTGAGFTCCNYLSVAPEIEETAFEGAETTYFGGIAVDRTVKAYKYHVKQFTVGILDLGARDIWMTFDDMVAMNILGMDILQDIAFAHNPREKVLKFTV